MSFAFMLLNYFSTSYLFCLVFVIALGCNFVCFLWSLLKKTLIESITEILMVSITNHKLTINTVTITIIGS